jgi:hypothetical protein
MKNCKQCSNQFEAKNTKGSEQLYCSKTCRNKASSKRFQENLINKHNENNIGINEQRTPGVNGTNERNNEYNVSNNERYNNERYPKTFDNEIITSIKETYEERSKGLFYQLKCEQLEKEVQELKQDIINLEMELDECNAETDEDNNGIISGLMTSFKQDPQNTISFATELITNFIKPKKTA